jgi:hypothetical protein
LTPQTAPVDATPSQLNDALIEMDSLTPWRIQARVMIFNPDVTVGGVGAGVGVTLNETVVVSEPKASVARYEKVVAPTNNGGGVKTKPPDASSVTVPTSGPETRVASSMPEPVSLVSTLAL